MLLFNEWHGTWFKDAFRDGEFQTDWKYIRWRYGSAEGATLVFYPHGNLSLTRNHIGEETKISAGAGDLLSTITGRWSSGRYVPIFVSEGTSKEKVAAIRRSRYLRIVLEEVLPELVENIVVYGWSFDERDQHVLDALSTNPQEHMAVSVFTGQSDAEQQAYCHHVLRAINRSMPGTTVTFFDSQSSGC